MSALELKNDLGYVEHFLFQHKTGHEKSDKEIVGQALINWWIVLKAVETLLLTWMYLF